MKKLVILSLGAAAVGINAQTALYDHSTADTSANFVNQKFGDFPTFSTGIVDDVFFGSSVTIQEVTIWTDRNSTAWLTGVNQGIVNVFNKTGTGPPNAANDPTTGVASAVTVTAVTNNGLDSYKVTARGLNIVKSFGTYYIGLTPIGDFGTVGQCFTRGADGAARDNKAYFRNPGGGFSFGTSWQTVDSTGNPYNDMALLVRGDILPEPATMAGLGLGILVLAVRRRQR